jgi:hypothetical protein
MLTTEDIELLRKKGINEERLEEQIESFQTGFPYLKVIRAATINDGISRIEESEKDFYIEEWRSYLKGNGVVLKFVPASGAASRMFKDLFEFQDSGSEIPVSKPVVRFFEGIYNFAFCEALNGKCKRNMGKDISELLQEKKYKNIVFNLLNEKGLNYGFLPKGLILFHRYPKDSRTPFGEHLVEGALYAKNSRGKVNLHFTVSHEHLSLFKKLLERRGVEYAYTYGADYDVTFSVQKPSTDTIAVDKDNNPFRSNGKLLFRPGGHGALIENLNDINADVIFIKNIDNVVPDPLKQPTIEYKAILAGLLVSLQKQIFTYQRLLDSGSVSREMTEEMLLFVKEKLSNFDQKDGLSQTNPVEYLKNKLNRPLRVCGMVKNEGEPGGGPYLCENQDGTISLQILESSQFNPCNSGQMEIMKQATHFNPVDLVCGVCNYKGEKYDLTRYVDKNTGFISNKSKDGRELKALELPGLWNGAMSDWNTVFVEVPIETFNPVKTVNDLLRKEHQS